MHDLINYKSLTSIVHIKYTIEGFRLTQAIRKLLFTFLSVY